VSSPYARSLDPGREWEKAEEVASHFNDLLMRVRTFGLPFVATAIGTGSGLGLLTEDTNVEVPWLALAVALGIAGVLLLVLVLYLRFWWRASNRRLLVSPLEYLVFLLVVLSLFSWVGVVAWKMNGLTQSKEFLFSAPVLWFGSLVLFSIYLLDRFYYTSLLIGAVLRCERIEHASGRRLNLSHGISFVAPHWTYTVLPTVLYLLPLILLTNIAAAVAVFSADAAPPVSHCGGT
jgi:vacuolar-type H+-ATPase subunit I/STV1